MPNRQALEAIGGGFVSADESKKPPRDLRLPGSVAEIMASPPGPEIGAFFDLDGTLVAGFTAIILTQERLRRRDMGVGELFSMVTAGLNHQLGRIEFEELIGKASGALRGRMLSDLEEIGERLFVQRIESRIYPEMRELVRAHLARGHTVVLSSSALTIQVAPVAKLPRHPQHAHQQVRDGRRRHPHRRRGQPRFCGGQARPPRCRSSPARTALTSRTATFTPTATKTSR